MAKISLHLQYYENETAVQKNEMINIKSLGRSFNKDRKIFGVSLKTSLELRQKRLLYDFCCPRRNKKERFRIIMSGYLANSTFQISNWIHFSCKCHPFQLSTFDQSMICSLAKKYTIT